MRVQLKHTSGRNHEDGEMTVLRAVFRRRPWLIGCLLVVGIGARSIAISPFEQLGFWLGILGIVGGVLMTLGVEVEYRRQQKKTSTE